MTASALPNLIQGPPTTATVADGAGYSSALTVTGATGTVSYVETVSADSTNVVVDTSGTITASASLAPGTYNVTGTDTDSAANTGTWGFSLTVSPALVTLSQGPPTTATVADGAGYSSALTVTGATGTVSYVETVSADSGDVVVGTSGTVTASASLAPGTYNVSGTDSDTSLDSGTWGFSLTISPALVTLSQGPPTAVTVADGAGYSSALTVTNATGLVTYAETVSAESADVVVDGSGNITASTSLAPGTYTVAGTDGDPGGDTGTWGFSLTVSSSGGGSPPPPATIKQSPPTSGVTTTANSANYATLLATTGATGVVSFVTTKSSPALSVSAQGAITTSGSLAVGSYSVSGTDVDPAGDAGTWAFTLTVNPSITVTFVANGGVGSISPQTESAPTALTPNVFTRAKHVFAQWNTAADGSGTSYANGASYPFKTSTTLYAQWIASTHVAPKHTVTFDANGGNGSMTPQKNNVLASLVPNAFTRAKFTFNGWNTAANDSGKGYANKGAYLFTKSTTLYAQWTAKKVATHVVTFKANGGRGSMTPESHTVTAPLTTNKFTRPGFSFAGWNTAGDGAGAGYVNHATFQFKKSVTLFAQWHAVVVPVFPAVHAAVTLRPFAVKSAALSATLEAQITSLANEIKANHDTKIALVGFSSDLTTANVTNEAAWGAALQLSRQRAQAVQTYLELQLALLGVTGYSVSVSQSGKAISDAENANAASRAEANKVVAALT